MNAEALKLSKEQQYIYNTSHTKAMKFFGIKHGDNLVLHHVNPELRHTDLERYIKWLPEDLVVLTPGEHTALHRAESREPRHTNPHSETTKEILSLKNSQPVICIETGVTYKSAKYASIMTSISQGNISGCCRGERKSAGGYHWKYL